MAPRSAEIVPGKYIVTLRPYATSQIKQAHLSHIREQSDDTNTSFNIKLDDEDSTSFEFPELKGYSAELDDDSRDELEAMDHVAAIEPVKIYRHCDVQSNAPWGLARISNREPLPPSGPYKYTSGQQGKGSTAYVIDTGINAEHEDFEGRATRGPKFAPDGTVDHDTNGHGTHVAGTIAGRIHGVAKEARIVSIKVFNDDPEPGSSNIDIIKALEWVMGDAAGKPAVVNMSLGGGTSNALDAAVAALVRSGVVVCCAAGNESANAMNSSPGREPLAITVGATNNKDEQAWFSNFGKLVDIMAPGVDILSTWIGSKDATNTISGTSMATPHVVGIVCCWLNGQRKESLLAVPELLVWAEKNRIKGLDKRTINALLHNELK